ncbi:ribonuclease P protein component [Canibacter oris]|uniref:ribonuclease P protein component n=1 Tax=Canibacter oris TaxID=1365628 RepID=UPI001614F43F|nr:ribonuclease P protein component [Canibacter oris]
MASKHRIKRGEDYRRIVRSGYRVGGKFCLAHAVLLSPSGNQSNIEAEKSGKTTISQLNVSRETSSNITADDTGCRFGFIITKTVGNAVTRNLLRRRLKSICEIAVKNGFSGAEVVFRVFPQAANVSYQELETAVLKQLQRVQERANADT